MFEAIAAFAAGIIVGAAVLWWAASGQRRKLAEAADQMARKDEDLRRQGEARAAAETIAARLPALESELRETRRQSEQRLSELVGIQGRSDAERVAAEEKLQVLEDAKRVLLDTFQSLSAQALQANNDQFLQLATSSMEKFQEQAKGDLEARSKAVENLVKPIQESLTRVDVKIGDIEKDRHTSYAALNEQLRGLVQEHIPRLHNETAGLVKALRQSSMRGRWGEIQLRRVVEMAGMLDHCDFIEQRSEETADGLLRPDLVVRLPGGKQIVVDSKVPLAAYLEAAEAKDDAIRDAHLAKHVQQVRTHIASLGRKAYWEAFQPTPEFVVMFLPGEAFFSSALQQDPSLIEYGVNEKVIPATPTTLIALLRAVAYGWRQESLAVNSAQIADLGKELYERICKLGEHWDRVGKRLGSAVEAYNQSVGTLEGRVLSSARKFNSLGAVATGRDIGAMTQIEQQVRILSAEELSNESPGGNTG